MSAAQRPKFDRKLGNRGGNVNRLNQQCKAYRQATDASGSRYDGSHGHRAADGSWRTFVTTARLKSTEPLLKYHDNNPDGSIRSVSPDALHTTIVHELEHPIRTEVVIDPFDLHIARK